VTTREKAQYDPIVKTIGYFKISRQISKENRKDDISFYLSVKIASTQADRNAKLTRYNDLFFSFFQRVVNINKCPNFRVLTVGIILPLAPLK
jgi:hypothetical protein